MRKCNLIHFTFVTVNRLVHAKTYQTKFMIRFKMLSNTYCVCVCVLMSVEKQRIGKNNRYTQRAEKSDQKRQLAYLWFVCSIDNDNNTSTSHWFGKHCVNVVMAYVRCGYGVSHSNVLIRCTKSVAAFTLPYFSFSFCFFFLAVAFSFSF